MARKRAPILARCFGQFWAVSTAVWAWWEGIQTISSPRDHLRPPSIAIPIGPGFSAGWGWGKDWIPGLLGEVVRKKAMGWG